MRSNRIDDYVGFTKTFDQVGPNDRVRAFHFVCQSLADVVEQAGAFGNPNVQSELTRHQTHEMGDFHRMIEQVLRVAMTEMQPAKDFHNIIRKRRQAGFGNRSFAQPDDRFVHFLVHLGDDLLDPRGVNAPVGK